MSDEQLPPRTPAHVGLHLPPTLGTASSTKQEVHQQWNTLPAIEADLASKGFNALLAPSFEYPGTVTPEQLTNPNNQMYSELYARHLGWYNYTAELLAETRAYLVQVENEMDDIASRLRIQERNKNKTRPKEDKLSKEDIEDAILQEPRYRDLKLDKQKHQQNKLLVEAWLEGMYRNLQVLSRQVTIRANEFEQTQVGSNLPGRNLRGHGPRS